jgi:hypothetical protein
MRDMNRIKKEFDGRGVQFLAVNVFDEVEVARDHVESSVYDFHWARADEETTSRLGIAGLPALIVVDGNGGVVWRSGLLTAFRGGSDLRRALEELTGGRS